MPEAPIRRRSPASSLEYIADRLQAAVEDGTEQTLRTVASQAVFSLRMLASESEESAPPSRGAHVLDMYTGEWVPVPDEELAEALRDRDAYAIRVQERFRQERLAEHPEAAGA